LASRIIYITTQWPATAGTEIAPDAAILAVRQWHEAQASKMMIQARRSRFPRNLEREAEVHRRSAELIAAPSPDDVRWCAGKAGVAAHCPDQIADTGRDRMPADTTTA
jgi:hypothetical protein